MRNQSYLPSPDEIMKMPYVELLALMGESNLPPGGFAGIRRLIKYNHIHSLSRVLHVGSSGGYLAREFARLTGCSVLGIDISQNMVNSANARAVAEGLHKKCTYICADARSYQTEEKFDVVLTGGALAFVQGQPQAINSMIAATKPYGFLTICELAYHKSPSAELRKKVAEIIGVEVPKYGQEHWLELMDSPELKKWKIIIKPESVPTDNEVYAYFHEMALWAGKNWHVESLTALENRLKECFLVFAENNRHLSSVFIACRKFPSNKEPMLFV